jgi:plasmid stability protein
MSIMTIRLPEEKHKRLKQLAHAQHVSVNKLIEDFATTALAGFDAEVHFRALAAHGYPKRALLLLDKVESIAKKKLKR